MDAFVCAMVLRWCAPFVYALAWVLFTFPFGEGGSRRLTDEVFIVNTTVFDTSSTTTWSPFPKGEGNLFLRAACLCAGVGLY